MPKMGGTGVGCEFFGGRCRRDKHPLRGPAMKKIIFILLAILSIAPAYAEGGHGGGGHGGGWGRGGGWGHGGPGWRGERWRGGPGWRGERWRGDPGWRGVGWGYGGWGWGDDWIAPALIGGAVAYDLSYPYAPIYAIADAPVYTPVLALPPMQYWYFCAASRTYYPYVSSCRGGWTAVPATPPDLPTH